MKDRFIELLVLWPVVQARKHARAYGNWTSGLLRFSEASVQHLLKEHDLKLGRKGEDVLLARLQHS